MSKSGLVIAWEFQVLPGQESRFEDAYGPRGPWVQLFRTDQHWVKTELQRDLSDPERYWTLDFWTSEDAYNQFRASHSTEYQRIDAECEELTASEVELGRFKPID